MGTQKRIFSLGRVMGGVWICNRLVFILLLFSAGGLAEAFRLPDSGQTKCYSVSGAEVSCAGTGQDGEYDFNPMTYADNGDGTVTDINTGLTWQKQDDGTVRTWDASSTYCSGITLGGLAGWRLPSKKELATIVDYRIPYEGPTINSAAFPNTKAADYWTSSGFSGNPYDAWCVEFSRGGVYTTFKTYGKYVRCVRGGQMSFGAYTDNRNGTVTDRGTGLMWQQSDGGAMLRSEAFSYCEGLGLGGYSDWRLPNIRELETLTDDTRNMPAINTAVFPKTNAGGFWSSTTRSYGKNFPAWIVNFFFGDSTHDKAGYYNARCVRGGTSGTCGAVFGLQDLTLRIPFITLGAGQASYWADLAYVPNTLEFAVVDAGVISDASVYGRCNPASLGQDLGLRVPDIDVGGSLYEASFIYSGGVVFTLVSASPQ